jgi:hypothetical protein
MSAIPDLNTKSALTLVKLFINELSVHLIRCDLLTLKQKSSAVKILVVKYIKFLYGNTYKTFSVTDIFKNVSQLKRFPSNGYVEEKRMRNKVRTIVSEDLSILCRLSELCAMLFEMSGDEVCSLVVSNIPGMSLSNSTLHQNICDKYNKIFKIYRPLSDFYERSEWFYLRLSQVYKSDDEIQSVYCTMKNLVRRYDTGGMEIKYNLCQFPSGKKFCQSPVGYYMTVTPKSGLKALQSNVNKMMALIGSQSSYSSTRIFGGNNYLSRKEYKLLLFAWWIRDNYDNRLVIIKNYTDDLKMLEQVLTNLQLKSLIIADVENQDGLISYSDKMPEKIEGFKIDYHVVPYASEFTDKLKGAYFFIDKLDPGFHHLISSSQIVPDRKYLLCREDISKVWIVPSGSNGLSGEEVLYGMCRKMVLKLYYPCYYEGVIEKRVPSGLFFEKIVAKAEETVIVVPDFFEEQLKSESGEPVEEKVVEVAFVKAPLLASASSSGQDNFDEVLNGIEPRTKQKMFYDSSLESSLKRSGNLSSSSLDHVRNESRDVRRDRGASFEASVKSSREVVRKKNDTLNSERKASILALQQLVDSDNLSDESYLHADEDIIEDDDFSRGKDPAQNDYY